MVKALINTDLMQLAVFGFFTGLGTTFGTELAKTAIEKIRQTMKIRDTYFWSFRRTLRTMHQIALKLFTPRNASRNLVGDVYILINEKGVINAVSEDEILRHPDISVISI